jgi:hypothetical protein
MKIHGKDRLEQDPFLDFQINDGWVGSEHGYRSMYGSERLNVQIKYSQNELMP